MTRGSGLQQRWVESVSVESARIFHRNEDNGEIVYKISQRVSLVDSATKSSGAILNSFAGPFRGGGQEARNKSIAIAMVTGGSGKMAVEIFPKTA